MARLGKGESRRGRLTDQPSQLEASRRRSRALSTSPVIADSCDERGESCAFFRSTQPLALESIIARWTSIAYRAPCIDLVNVVSAWVRGAGVLRRRSKHGRSCKHERTCKLPLAQVQPKAACDANGAVMLRPGGDLDSSSVPFGKLLFCGGRVWEE